MAWGRWRIGKCCGCGPGECKVTLESRNPCSTPTANALVGSVEIKVYKASDHGLAGTYTTDGSGVVDATDLTPGVEYDAVSYKSGSGQGALRFTAVCGSTYVVPVSSQRRSIRVRGCGSIEVPGAIVTVTKSPDFWVQGVTDSTGLFYFHPPTTGSYSYSVAAGSKFAPASGSISNPSLCGTSTLTTVSLTPASGHKCCGNSCVGTPQRCHPYPVKFPLTVSLSTGESFTINDCSGNACIQVAVDNAGGAPIVNTCPGFCGFEEPPSTAPGDVDWYVSVGISGGDGRPIGTTGGNHWVVQYRPGRTCATSCSGANTHFEAWWRNDLGCPGGGNASTGWAVHSSEPYSATLYFSYAGVDSGLIGVDTPGPSFPVTSITITEAP